MMKFEYSRYNIVNGYKRKSSTITCKRLKVVSQYQVIELPSAPEIVTMPPINKIELRAHFHSGSLSFFTNPF